MAQRKIDLHMHSTVSDGTDTPADLLSKIEEAGIDVFSITDHDAIKAAEIITPLLGAHSPRFISGVEFSCRDEEGKYHILGYGYEPGDEHMKSLVEKTHSLRMTKVYGRLDFLRDEFGFTFSDEDTQNLLKLDNPGKPHIGNLMVKYGYVKTKEEGIEEYLNKKKFKDCYIRPEEAIGVILKAGAIPVLAHPTYGDGGQLILGDDMRLRLEKLIGYGLKGVEAFYSGFSEKIIEQMLSFAEEFNLYATAGSDYHGANKLVILGDNNLDTGKKYPENLERFLSDVRMI